MFACCSASTGPSTETSAVSFCSPMKSFSSGGITRRTACGQDHVAQRLAAGEPERAGRRLLAGVHRLDARPVHLGDVGACRPAPAQTTPQKTGSVGTPGQLQGRDAEPEQVDDQDRGHAAEQVGVARSPSAAAGRTPGPGRLRITASSSAKTRISTSATRNILMFSRNAWRDRPEVAPRNSAALKNACLTVGQPGELTIDSTTSARTPPPC